MITKYGYDVVLIIGVIVLAAYILAFFVLSNPFLKISIIAVFSFLFLFTLYFFRDPERNIPNDDNLILSPADGKVVLIKSLEHVEYLNSPATQVSIFLSPLNVHVNRIPMSGVVGHFRYIRGKYKVAYDHKASEKNERTEIGIERNNQRIVFKQIVGSIARRIVCDLREGVRVSQGERFGMIKFGSRTDVIFPQSFNLNVRVGEKVKAGESILAVIPQPAD